MNRCRGFATAHGVFALLAILAIGRPCFADDSGFGSTERCVAVHSSWKLGEVKTVASLEEESLRELSTQAARVPQVPFGFANGTWAKFKNQAQPGDRIQRFTAPLGLGLVLMRGDCLIATFVTLWV